MITAAEARANVKNHDDSLINEKLAEADIKITEISRRGETSLCLSYDEKIPHAKMEKVANILRSEENGYAVTHNVTWHYLMIKWD